MSDTLIRVSMDDERVAVLLRALELEYEARYGESRAQTSKTSEVHRYPAVAFQPPLGDFLILVRDGRVVAGGAYMSHDDQTVEIKRVWTDASLRRQGLSRSIMSALENSAIEQGYSRCYLTTGFRQPEACGLYRSLGYRPLFDLSVDPQLIRSLPFEKFIGQQAGRISDTPWRPAAASAEAANAVVAAIKNEQERRILDRIAHYQSSQGSQDRHARAA